MANSEIERTPDRPAAAEATTALAPNGEVEQARAEEQVPAVMPTPLAVKAGRRGGRQQLETVEGNANVRPFRRKQGNPAPYPVNDAEYRKLIAKARAPARRIMLATFALVVLLPTLITGLYYAFIASDQYAVSVKFAVRGNDSPAGDVAGMLLGATGSSASTSDSYIVQDFIASREMIERLERRTDVVGRYTLQQVDWFSRAAPEDPIEDFLEYWQSMVRAEFDVYSSVVTVQVKAFTPEDSQELATLILDESSNLVNRLSEQARSDTLALAQREVAFAEERLRDARGAVATFSGSANSVDFAASAEAQQQTVSRLEAEIVNARAELGQLLGLSEQAPSVRVLKTRIAALEKELEGQRLLVAGSGAADASPGMTAQLGKFRELQTDVEFAEKAYLSSMAALDLARAEAKKTHRYLAVFVNPSLPASAEYPLRLINTLLVAAVCAVLWAIGSLLVAAVRDHSA
jgi:capsular polysaccharide transport system permease protein